MDAREFAAFRRELSDGLIAALAALWDALPSWHREDVAGFLADALPLVAAAQRTLADLVAVKVAENAEEALSRFVRPPLLPDSAVTDLRRGVTPDDVYTRPFIEVWSALKDGLPLDEATSKGRLRLKGIAEFDMQQAHAEATAKAQKALEAKDRPKWWERTLTGTENCGLCMAASTRVYRVGELDPIHPGCDCGVQEHWDKPPTGVLHPGRLADAYQSLYDETGTDSTRADLLRDVITTHGELGQILTRPRRPKTSAK